MFLRYLHIVTRLFPSISCVCLTISPPLLCYSAIFSFVYHVLCICEWYIWRCLYSFLLSNLRKAITSNSFCLNLPQVLQVFPLVQRDVAIYVTIDGLQCIWVPLKYISPNSPVRRGHGDHHGQYCTGSLFMRGWQGRWYCQQTTWSLYTVNLLARGGSRGPGGPDPSKDIFIRREPGYAAFQYFGVWLTHHSAPFQIPAYDQ